MNDTTSGYLGIGDTVTFRPEYANVRYPSTRVYRVIKINPKSIVLEDANGSQVKTSGWMVNRTDAPMPAPTAPSGEDDHLILGEVVTVRVPVGAKWGHAPTTRFVCWGYKPDGKVKLAKLGGDSDRYAVVPRGWLTRVTIDFQTAGN